MPDTHRSSHEDLDEIKRIQQRSEEVLAALVEHRRGVKACEEELDQLFAQWVAASNRLADDHQRHAPEQVTA